MRELVSLDFARDREGEPDARVPPPDPYIMADHYGIPEHEFTASVRAALTALNERAEYFRREAEKANARFADAAKYADLDVLLPVLNRRAFLRELDRFIAFAERYGTPSCLFYFDIDMFKSVNDRFGHAAGDYVLGHFASVMSGQIRDTDVLARIGGDEFGIILAHATTDQAVAKGERLMHALDENPPLWQGQPVRLRCSSGIHRLRAGESAEEAVIRADQAMYAHKRGQR